MTRVFAYALSRQREVRARFYLNDLPVREELDDRASHCNEPLNALIVPGENVVRLEIDQAPPGSDVLWLQIGGGEERDQPEMLVDYHFTGSEHEPPKLPYVWTTRFVAEGVGFQPAYAQAPAEPFDTRGTPELVAAVKKVFSAIENKDGEGLFELYRLRHDEHERAFEGHTALAQGPERERYRRFFALDQETQPFDADQLYFERRAHGRVAIARRLDGKRLVHTHIAGKPGAAMSTDLWFLKHAGDWRLFY